MTMLTLQSHTHILSHAHSFLVSAQPYPRHCGGQLWNDWHCLFFFLSQIYLPPHHILFRLLSFRMNLPSTSFSLLTGKCVLCHLSPLQQELNLCHTCIDYLKHNFHDTERLLTSDYSSSGRFWSFWKALIVLCLNVPFYYLFYALSFANSGQQTSDPIPWDRAPKYGHNTWIHFCFLLIVYSSLRGMTECVTEGFLFLSHLDSQEL